MPGSPFLGLPDLKLLHDALCMTCSSAWPSACRPCHRAGRSPVPGLPAAAAAAASLRRVPRSRELALWIADAVLARRLGWPAPVPLLASQIKRAELRLAAETSDGAAWAATCHLAYARAGIGAIDLHADLARRAGKLIAVAPQLRGKDADRTLRRLLSEDAQAATAGKAASDRSSRRLFDRLVQLEAVRELTGRPTFRLYGL